MIYFTTKAFNAETTLGRAVESVLAQTYGDFRYYICDNGSQDGTGELIREYAGQDKRIVPVFQYPNCRRFYDDGTWCRDFERYIARPMFYLEPSDWLASLDSDDEYAPDFLEETLRFAGQERLDYVACCSDHIREPEGISDNRVVLEADIVIEREGFDTLFPNYFRYMGAYWGKLRRGSLFHRIDRAAFEQWHRNNMLFYREDTAMELYFLRYSERAGVRAALLHRYHIYPEGTSSRQSKDKLAQDNLKMPGIYRAFLLAKSGYVSEKNERYIQEVFERSQRMIGG